MENIRYYESEDGFFVDYIFEDNGAKKCFRLIEDDDYFAFCCFSPAFEMKNVQEVDITESCLLYAPLCSLIGDNKFIEILEEGTGEGKRLAFIKEKNNIKLVFGLQSTKANAISFSITNVRLSSPSVTFSEKSPKVEDFKNKLHSMMVRLKESLQEGCIEK